MILSYYTKVIVMSLSLMIFCPSSTSTQSLRRATQRDVQNVFSHYYVTILHLNSQLLKNNINNRDVNSCRILNFV